eukprot:m.24732 g.24732  ORF g.24732 m.24732 type:complete len:195 (-) comp8630_c1_seq2:407-991(-)
MMRRHHFGSCTSTLVYIATLLAVVAATTTWKVVIRFGETPTYVVFPSTTNAGAGFINIGGSDSEIVSNSSVNGLEQQLQNASSGDTSVNAISFTNDTGTLVGEFEITTDGDENPLNISLLNQFDITFIDRDGNERNETFFVNSNPNDPDVFVTKSKNVTFIVLGAVFGVVGLVMLLIVAKVAYNRQQRNKVNPF